MLVLNAAEPVCRGKQMLQACDRKLQLYGDLCTITQGPVIHYRTTYGHLNAIAVADFTSGQKFGAMAGAKNTLADAQARMAAIQVVMPTTCHVLELDDLDVEVREVQIARISHVLVVCNRLLHDGVQPATLGQLF